MGHRGYEPLYVYVSFWLCMRQPVSLKSLARFATNANNSITRPKQSRAPSYFCMSSKSNLGRRFWWDQSNQDRLGCYIFVLDVVALRSGASFLETGMFLDDGLAAGSWEMFMRIWMTKRVESSVLPSMKLWSTKNGGDFRLTCKWCQLWQVMTMGDAES